MLEAIVEAGFCSVDRGFDLSTEYPKRNLEACTIIRTPPFNPFIADGS